MLNSIFGLCCLKKELNECLGSRIFYKHFERLCKISGPNSDPEKFHIVSSIGFRVLCTVKQRDPQTYV